MNEFEKACAEKFGRKYGIAVSNGSVALDVAFQMLDLNEDDEVILPSFAIISCLSAVLRTKKQNLYFVMLMKTHGICLLKMLKQK